MLPLLLLVLLQVPLPLLLCWRRSGLPIEEAHQCRESRDAGMPRMQARYLQARSSHGMGCSGEGLLPWV